MSKGFRNRFCLLLLLVCLVVRSISDNPVPVKTTTPLNPDSTSHLSSCTHLSNSETEESDGINEVDLGNKLPFAKAVIHFNTVKSIIFPAPAGLTQRAGRKILIAPFYSRILFPFHVFW